MAQGDFTREEAEVTRQTFQEVFQALSKPKQRDFIGHANDIFLFLGACVEKCPSEKAVEKVADTKTSKKASKKAK